jgi:hypothetical protein
VVLAGKNGNRWAYEKRPAASAESFRSTERKWAKWGIIVDATILVLYIVIAGSAGS